MKCPFLEETRVRSCRRSAFRKWIARAADPADHEKCSSHSYADCAIYLRYPLDEPRQPVCPFLDDVPVQFCAAAATAGRFIPAATASLGRCGDARHQYCELYLALAAHVGETSGAKAEHSIDGIATPRRLEYTANHMWFHSCDGWWHIGIDAFLARALGCIERITFATTAGLHRPAATLTVRGVDLTIEFPAVAHIASANLYLRAHPEKLTSAPYTFGWLFEGIDPAGICPVTRLRQGDDARRWMHGEVERLSAFAHRKVSAANSGVLADGGIFAEDLAEHLGRDEILALFHDFFSVARQA
jgi:glycine cleavage system H lipoate-binding protein